MSKLIFNPEKDMKELKMYGFKYIDVSKVQWANSNNNYWCKKVYLGDDYDNRVFYLINEKDRYYHVDSCESGVLDNTTYDLIKANLIIDEEKLKNEN